MSGAPGSQCAQHILLRQNQRPGPIRARHIYVEVLEKGITIFGVEGLNGLPLAGKFLFHLLPLDPLIFLLLIMPVVPFPH